MIIGPTVLGLWTWPKQWFRLRTVLFQTDAEPVMVKF